MGARNRPLVGEIAKKLAEQDRSAGRAPPLERQLKYARQDLNLQANFRRREAFFQASSDDLPTIDIHSLRPLPGAGTPRSRQVARLGETPRRHEKNATSGGKGDQPRTAFQAGAASGGGSNPLTSRSSVGRRWRKCH